MIWWITTALAASPGGIRVGPGVPTHMVSVREVLVTHPGNDFTISQTTLRAQYGNSPYGLDLELPIVVAWGGGWKDQGLGQVRLGGRVWLGAKHAPVSLGVELAAPLPYSLRTQVWGSLARDTIAGWEMLLVAEGSVWPTPDIACRNLGAECSAWMARPVELPGPSSPKPSD